MGYMSIETVKNDFNIYKVGNDFFLLRNLVESISADDFLLMKENMEREIKIKKEELATLELRMKTFKQWEESAKITVETIRKEGKEKMFKYLDEQKKLDII